MLPYIISPSPVGNVGFGGTAGVTAKSTCCQSAALFVSVETAGLLQFAALRRNVVAVHFENCGFTFEI
jgi:hypothetical protein